MINNKNIEELASKLITEINKKTIGCIVYTGVINEKNIKLSEDVPEVFRHLTTPNTYRKPHHVLDYDNMVKRVSVVEKNYNISTENPKNYYYLILCITFNLREEYKHLNNIEKNHVDIILDQNGIYIDLMKSTDHTMVAIKKNKI